MKISNLVNKLEQTQIENKTIAKSLKDYQEMFGKLTERQKLTQNNLIEVEEKYEQVNVELMSCKEEVFLLSRMKEKYDVQHI